MNKKVYKTLEYNKILTMLSSYAACDETKKRCLSLEPITDLYEIRHLQTTTADALSRLYKDSGISFVGIHNVHASLKRLDIGGALNTTELLRICSLLEIALKNTSEYVIKVVTCLRLNNFASFGRWYICRLFLSSMCGGNSCSRFSFNQPWT
jgi:dsDNA-specific endonuclease/ATPase MutS2